MSQTEDSIHLYHPDGLFVWDTWYLNSKGRVHVFHLQVKRPESTRPDEDQGTIGHAVSHDLLCWEELPTALRRGAPGASDDGTLFTGYAIEHEDVIYLFYCGNHRTEDGQSHQTIWLATSEDGINFVRHPDNPIITPDGVRYRTRDCRDIAVLKDPAGEGWLGYLVMRFIEEKPFRSFCIVLCRSKDLVHWEVGDPVFTPDRYKKFEVPDVFCLDGRWYMINLTGDNYQHRNRWSDPGVRCGTIVAEADGPEGPFREVQDNVLLAANDRQGYSARTVEVDGERLLLYTHSEETSHGCLSWPVKLAPRPGGGLLPVYWHGIDYAFGTVRQAPPVRMDLDAGDGWVVHPMESLSADGQAFMVSASITLESVKSAGLAFRHAKGSDRCYVALLDPANGEVALVTPPTFEPIQRLRRDIRPGKTYNVRVVAVDTFIQVYVDDVLALNCHSATLSEGGAALFVEEGSAGFCDIKYHSA